MNDIDAWAAGLLERTYEEWRSLETLWRTGQYAYWPHGFIVFMSPIRVQPRVLLLGMAPGGGPDDFKLARATQIPRTHEYWEFPHAMGTAIKRLFGDCQATALLRESVKTNRRFFRCPNETEWGKVPAFVSRRIEAYCDPAVLEIIRVLRPQMVVTEGFGPQTWLRKRVFVNHVDLPATECVLHPGTDVLRISDPPLGQAGPKVVGVIHPTGAYTRPHFEHSRPAITSRLTPLLRPLL